MAHGNDLYFATLVSGRYANREHSSAVIKTEEHGNIACSEIDFAYLWDRRGEIEMAPFEVVGPPEPMPENQEADGEEHAAFVLSDEANATGGIALPALPPLPDAIQRLADEQVPEEVPPAAIRGDWRAAIKAMDPDFEFPSSSEDYGLGSEIEPEPILEAVPLDEPLPEIVEMPSVIEEEPQVFEQKHQVATEPLLDSPLPAAVEPPPVPRTIVVDERKTITDATWGKAQIRYEVAIQAKNGSAYHKGLMMDAASRRGISVLELADEILRERDEMVQRVMSEF